MHNIVRNEKATEEASVVKNALATREVTGGELIRGGAVVADDFVDYDASRAAYLGVLQASQQGENVIYPYAIWLENREAIIDNAKLTAAKIGVLITSATDPKLLEADLKFLALIAIQFDKFADGRGYSTAALLRSRYGFTGEIRAVGDVLRDQIFYMKRSGFTSYQIRSGKSAAAALASFNDFSIAYQHAAGDADSLTPARGLDLKVAQLKTLLAQIETEFAPAAFASSYGAEDMVLTDLVAKHFPKIEIFSLNTGRLPKETLALATEVAGRYDVKVQSYLPDEQAVADYVATSGINGFYESVEARKSCCNIRKVEPLRCALAGKKAWITGLRRDQADSRQALNLQTDDAAHSNVKFNPLLDWTADDVWAYLRANDVPYNALHDRGYPSIGCEPCTRATKAGEHPRAGRWWWENAESGNQECGLHVAQSVVPIHKFSNTVNPKINEQSS